MTNLSEKELNSLLIKGYVDIAKKELRKGPISLFMKEYEDDSKLVLPKTDLSTGIPTWSRNFSDLEKGVVILAADSNHGKSTIFVNLMLNLLELNDDTIVVDLSIDDELEKRRQQYVAKLTGLNYQEVNCQNDEMEKDQLGIIRGADRQIIEYYKHGRLKTFVGVFEYTDSEGVERILPMRDFNNLWALMRTMRERYPDKKIYFFLDAWNDMGVDAGPGRTELENNKHFLNETKQRCINNDIVLFISNHLRKDQGNRPTLADIKGGGELGYAAKWVGVLYNEYVALQGQNDPLMIQGEDGDLIPIVVVSVPKNKSSAWREPLIFGLDSFRCQLVALTPEDYRHYRGKWVSKLNPSPQKRFRKKR